MNLYRYLIVFICILLIFSCGEEKKETAIFTLLEAKTTGLHFNNKLTPLPDLNMLKYMYFYNGAGVGAGDFNNDGKIDLFFAGNQVSNKLYLNTGDLSFKDVTPETGIPDDKGWSTGVSVVDINQDGLLDIYVCRVGRYASLKNHNLLLVCKEVKANGVPVYEDRSAKYGLDFSGFSTQAAFFDADLDGDLDMYLLNHSLRYNSTFQPRENYRDTYDSLSGDRLYRNDNGKFTDITKQSGIHSSVIGYGLGICVSDINLDGLPDLYIANDFHENDYLYINKGNGVFSDELDKHIMHTSQFSMGVDVGDINNDALPEIITLDMLPEDPYILKRSLGEDEYNLFNMKLKFGYNHQYTRNNLQFNRGNGMFSEIGFYAGVAATDWSWSPLFVDFDNDGKKDLFISNGIPKRLNDIDYVNYISNEQIQSRIRDNKMDQKDLAFIDKFPQIKLRNKFFSNNGNLKFNDREKNIANDKPTYSNGAVYADFDNDGDLDIAVNNIDDEAYLYRNNNDSAKSISIILQGGPLNKNAIGARVVAYAGSERRIMEKFPVRGFQSSMEVPLLVGTYGGIPDSLVLVWPDNSYEKLTVDSSRTVKVKYRTGLKQFDYSSLRSVNKENVFEDITAASGLEFLHRENSFVEFNREPLMPFMVSSEGPALAVADMNMDGLDDVFIGASKGNKSALFLQSANNKFSRSAQPILDADSLYEDVDAVWADVNGDKFPDLVVASGGNEFYGNDEHMLPRLYINQGGKQLIRQSAFPPVASTSSCIVAYDFNGDGFIDIFLGGRSVPFEYGEIPHSYIFMNDGKGQFKDATGLLAPELSQAGMVKDADIVDIDGDGRKDLVIALEWGGIWGFLQQQDHRYVRRTMTVARGWWNCVKPVDLDNDGDTDFILGNLGENSRLSASSNEPVKMYIADFDGNGKKEQVMSYYLKGQEIPFANKAELEKQMPGMKKKFLYAEDFAKATMDQIFDRAKLNASYQLSADYFSNAALINEGGMKFTLKALPALAQLSSMRDAVISDFNNDGLMDVVTGGNFYGSSVSVGRNDGDFGTLLMNKGNGKMEANALPGLVIKNEIRKILPLKIGKENVLVVARNNDSTMLIRKRGS